MFGRVKGNSFGLHKALRPWESQVGLDQPLTSLSERWTNHFIQIGPTVRRQGTHVSTISFKYQGSEIVPCLTTINLKENMPRGGEALPGAS